MLRSRHTRFWVIASAVGSLFLVCYWLAIVRDPGLSFPVSDANPVHTTTEAIAAPDTTDLHTGTVETLEPVDSAPQHSGPRRANATFYMLARNSDIYGVLDAIEQIEKRFNRRFGYPYVFLNDMPFTEAFKERVANATNATVEFGKIPNEYWLQPFWIDEEKAAGKRKILKNMKVPYGDSVSYRNMCRFNSGFFYRHELMQKYRWYWRIEPGVKFHCDILTDPFLYLEESSKTYGFSIAAKEIRTTVYNLWWHVKKFIDEHPEYVAQNNAVNFISNNDGGVYNYCHFWSNFEIADMEFFRGPAYSAFFDMLDQAGGFYYQRWGDAPVHSLALALFLDKTKLHFFDDIGYQHDDWTHCPSMAHEEVWKGEGKCDCDPENNFGESGRR
ncbi:hypothetical protein AX16_006407 [Volvariella volvacea WC 439]|nr:hypothetical protein AX16_006407 [Volvariella volvacea WC 439]